MLAKRFLRSICCCKSNAPRNGRGTIAWRAFLLAVLIAIGSVTIDAPRAQDNTDGGAAAYARGDYETALKLWLERANQGDYLALAAPGHLA